MFVVGLQCFIQNFNTRSAKYCRKFTSIFYDLVKSVFVLHRRFGFCKVLILIHIFRRKSKVTVIFKTDSQALSFLHNLFSFYVSCIPK